MQTGRAGSSKPLSVTRLERSMMLMVLAGVTLVSMDSGFFTFAYPLIQAQLHISLQQIGFLYATIFAVGAVANLVLGQVMDRIGRKPAFQFSLLATAIGSGLSGLAGSFGSLLVVRSLTQLGGSSEFLSGQTLNVETVRPQFRWLALATGQSGYVLGWFLASLISLILIPIVGWRWLFAIGVLPALFILWFRRSIPESERFQDVKRLRAVSREQARSVDVSTIAETVETKYIIDKRAAVKSEWRQLIDPSLLRTTIVIVVATMCMTYSAAAPQFWLPALIGGRHFVLSQVQLLSVWGTGIAFPGYFICGWLGGRIGRREATLLFLILGAGAGYFFGFRAHSFTSTAFWFAAWQFFELGLYGAFVAYVEEIFPTRARGVGNGVFQASVWLSWMIAGLTGPLLFAGIGVDATFAMWMMGFAVLAFVALLFGRHVVPTAELEEIAV